jgi:Rps23 Pro-64 3,4-dihydroxylase Tpa1-like proline 4-hydroxylase
MIEDFLFADPFPHSVIDDFLPPRVTGLAAHEFDDIPAGAWHVYKGADEAEKRTCRDMERLRQAAPVCHDILSFFTSSAAARMLGALTGVTDLEPDQSLYGAGLSAMPDGSQLGLHLDNEIHPDTGMLRRLNAIVFLGGSDVFGGHLELYDGMRRLRREIEPTPGRLVLMETGTKAYHGVGKVSARNSAERRAISAFYWSPPRVRARFLPRAWEVPDAVTEAARIARSQ